MPIRTVIFVKGRDQEAHNGIKAQHSHHLEGDSNLNDQKEKNFQFELLPEKKYYLKNIISYY